LDDRVESGVALLTERTWWSLAVSQTKRVLICETASDFVSFLSFLNLTAPLAAQDAPR
jgi:hypothetical protein